MPYITIPYERTKLYEEIRSEAVTTIAKRHGVSDVPLRKICKELAVPLPTTERRALDISVSEAILPRALRIMDGLIQAMDARGRLRLGLVGNCYDERQIE